MVLQRYHKKVNYCWFNYDGFFSFDWGKFGFVEVWDEP
jgi:hypothetical protein